MYKYATDKGEALKVGDYTLMDIWDLEDMKITLTCSNMSGLLVSVDYTSKQYFEEHESDDL